ncbi:DUF305 domain-containing protein [Saccharospirillum mangrovi]|uniref:DUF305 domain-containing protein n=1 Tax=Saccharospirillum mangrovi TaxID=2161747 RepID=UPI0013003134|nr:DUF305 domain-containing protein [Saccharospirillum mangrovi]
MHRSTVALALMSVLMSAMAASQSPDNDFMQAREQLMSAVFEVTVSGDPDVDFAHLMVAHQSAALPMIKTVLAQTDDPTFTHAVERLAQQLNDDIDALNTWLERYDTPDLGADADVIRQAYQTALDEYAQQRGDFVVEGDENWVFANAMLWHQSLVITLDQLMLNHSVDAQLRILAGDGVRHANRDIAELRNWMQTRELE